MDEMKPAFITKDSKLRRLMYMNDIKRTEEEENFNGPQENFLASLNMVFTISPAKEGDYKGRKS
jgi:predicted enzyme involved in methoxymalonyl-ACP biosynthesis